MKQDKATTSIPVQYVPYGINGEYFIYNNESNSIPIGYGHIRGTKKFIQKACDDLNKEHSPSIPVNDELNIKYDGNDNENYSFWVNGKEVGELQIDEDTAMAICTAVNETYGKGYNPAAMEELYKELADVIPVLQYKGDCETVIERIKTALHNAKTIKK